MLISVEKTYKACIQQQHFIIVKYVQIRSKVYLKCLNTFPLQEPDGVQNTLTFILSFSHTFGSSRKNT